MEAVLVVSNKSQSGSCSYIQIEYLHDFGNTIIENRSNILSVLEAHQLSGNHRLKNLVNANFNGFYTPTTILAFPNRTKTTPTRTRTQTKDVDVIDTATVVKLLLFCVSMIAISS